MTVSVESAISGPFTPNGVTTSFPFTFKAGSATEVGVVDQDGTALSTALYSVSLDDDEGGSVLFSVAPALADYGELYIVSTVALTQTADFDNAGTSFNPAALTRALDRAAVRDLKQQLEIDRTFKVPFGEDGPTFPSAAERANLYPVFDADGNLSTSAGTGADAGMRTDLASTASGKGAALVAGAFKIINVTEYGVSAGATAANNLANFKLAVAACPDGGKLRVPPATTPYLIDTSGGLSAAIEIDKRIELIVDGNLQASGSPTVEANPEYMVKVTADGVSVSGSGRFIGNGTINDVNTGTDDTFPGLLYVSGDDFCLSGVAIVSPPKVGVMLYGCERAVINGVRFTGGPTVYSDTAHFGIRLNQGGKHTIRGCKFYPDAGGGMFVQCVFANSSNDNVIDGCFADAPFEKLAYLFGNGNQIINNVIEGNAGNVPGTNIAGSITDAIRVQGANNRIEGNQTNRCAAGVQAKDGAGNIIRGNKFLNCGQTAISYNTANVAGAVVSDNECTAGALQGSLASYGIYVDNSGGAAAQIDVSRNRVSGFSISDRLANLPLRTNATAYGLHSVVKPTTPNSRYFQVTTAGTSGGSEPTWNTTPGGTTTDGTVVWTTVAYDTSAEIADIYVGGAGGSAVQYATVYGNTSVNARYGIITNYMQYSKVTGNITNSFLFGYTENNGSFNRWEWNDEKAAADIVRNLSATSVFVNYAEGAWTPNQGAGLSVSGAFASSGRYTRVGRAVHVTFEVSGATSISLSSAGAICSNLPVVAGVSAAGSHGNGSLTNTGQTIILVSQPTTLYGSAGPTGVSAIFGSITYHV